MILLKRGRDWTSWSFRESSWIHWLWWILWKIIFFPVSTRPFNVDVEFCTPSNTKELFKANVNFVTRLMSNYKQYNDLVKDHPDVCTPENRTNTTAGLCTYNVRRYSWWVRTAAMSTSAWIPIRDTKKRFWHRHMNAEGFRSTKLMKIGIGKQVHPRLILHFFSDDVLDVYYMRRSAQQFLDLANGYANLAPLMMHSEEAIRSMMMLTFIASPLIRWIQILLKGTSALLLTAMLALAAWSACVSEGDLEDMLRMRMHCEGRPAMKRHSCVDCGLIIDHDINTMINILNRDRTAGPIYYDGRIAQC